MIYSLQLYGQLALNSVAERMFLSRVAIETLERSTSVRFQTRRTDLTETNQARIQDIGTQPIQKQDERPCPDISFPPFTHLFFVLPLTFIHSFSLGLPGCTPWSL